MGIDFLSWFGWHGCYVIFHIKLLFLAMFEPLIFLDVFESCFSFVMIWYHHVGGIWYLPVFYVSNP
jgi:hypothetical protein